MKADRLLRFTDSMVRLTCAHITLFHYIFLPMLLKLLNVKESCLINNILATHTTNIMAMSNDIVAWEDM
jgi:hypothetical protein